MTTQAIDLLCATQGEIAAELGISLDSMKSYRGLRRSPSPETARALADLMRRRAKALEKLAERMEEKLAERMEEKLAERREEKLAERREEKLAERRA